MQWLLEFFTTVSFARETAALDIRLGLSGEAIMACGEAGLELRGEMAGDVGKNGHKLGRRAQRYAVQLSMRYREKGNTESVEGTTLNISASGVLFQSETMVQPQTAIEIALFLPVAIPGESPAEIVCQGTVTRNVPAKVSGGSHALAAAFQHYRISKAEDSRQ